MSNKMTAVCLMLGAASFASAQSTESVEPNSNDISPVSGIVIGKVKYVRLNELSPVTRKIAEADLSKNALAKNALYGEIPDEAVMYRKNYLNNLRDFHEVKWNLTFQLADTSGSAFDKYKFEGVVPEGPSKKGPWSSVSRYFSTPDGLLLVLHEWDYVGDGGGVMIVEELMNTKVRDTPARFSVKKSPLGSMVSELLWATPSKYYTLTAMGEVKNDVTGKYNVAWMTDLAAKLK